MEKKNHTARNIILVVIALSLCGIAGCIAVVVGGIGSSISEADKKKKADESAAAATCAGKKYPDQQTKNDTCANDAGSVELNGVTVTSSPLKRDAEGNLCTQVSYENKSGETVSFNPIDWKVQAPNGEVQNNVFAGSGNLGSGQLIDGGTKSGSICFDPIVGNGVFITIYKPSFLNDRRGIWISTI